MHIMRITIADWDSIHNYCSCKLCQSVYVHPPIQLPPPNTHMQALRSEEREREKEWDRRRVAEAKAGLVLESQLEKKQRDLRKKLAEENRQLAAEQRAKLV